MVHPRDAARPYRQHHFIATNPFLSGRLAEEKSTGELDAFPGRGKAVRGRADSAPRISNDLITNQSLARRKDACRKPRDGFATEPRSTSEWCYRIQLRMEGSIVLEPMPANRTAKNITPQDGWGYR